MISTVKKHILALTLACYCLLAQWQIVWADVPPPEPIHINNSDEVFFKVTHPGIYIGATLTTIIIWIIAFFVLRWIKKKNDNR